MSFYQGSMLLGSGLGPTLGGFVAEYFGLRAPFFALAILSVVSAVWAYLRLPETHHLLEQGAVPKVESGHGPTSRISSTGAGLKALLQNINFMTISIVSFGLFFMRTGSRGQLLPLLADDRLGASPGQIGIAMTLISVFNFLILIVCGTLSDRFGRKILITPGVILSAAALAMLAQAYSYWFLILTCIIWGIGTGISGPLPAAYVADVIPRENYSHGMGLYRAIGDLGFVTGPILLGWMADTKGYGFALWFNCLFLLVTIIVFHVLAREPSRVGRQPTKVVIT
jgi:MFS family permease